MAVPTFLASSKGSATGSTNDVNDIITAFDTLVSGQTPAWTDLGGGLFKSPVDASGRFFDVLLTAISTTNLEWRVRDQNAVTICTRRMQIVAGPQNYWIAAGQFYCWIEIDNVTVEAVGAGILDLSPESQVAHTQYVWGRGSRTTADAIDAAGNAQVDFFMLDNAVATSARRTMAQDKDAAATSVTMVTGAGTVLALPVYLECNFGGAVRWAGKCHQMFMAGGTGTAIVLPVGDAGETGTFRNSNLVLDGTMRLLFRTA